MNKSLPHHSFTGSKHALGTLLSVSVQARIPILFIAGMGRSGSTLLERLIAERDGYFAIGEMHYVWSRGLEANERCSCGTPFNNCPFWSDVLELASKGDTGQFAELAALQQHLGRIRRIPDLRFPLLRTATRQAELGRFFRWHARLYEAILDQSASSIIVDSSKEAWYGYLLAANPRFDVRVIHLVRDSRAVAYSWQRRRRRPEAVPGGDEYMTTFDPRTAAKLWLECNAWSGGLRRHVAHGALLRYEDFADQPALVDATLQMLDLPTAISSGPYVDNRHTVSGNPNRLDGRRAEVRRDVEWVNGMDEQSRSVVTRLSAPGLIRYGYPLRAS